ncbi:hypothetical protein [Thiolinea disciformis]|uniref:hypothetical protein n=1 Tax=Thiolinea disciformis TaxID=125614 RepID=UPI000362E057|nr:hypothetical protein [Thiolinea disciformis]
MLPLMPGALFEGVGRSQAVKLGGWFDYIAVPKVSYVGDNAVVSFEVKGETLELSGIELLEGASHVNKWGNAVHFYGLARCHVVKVRLCLVSGKKRSVAFMFQ